MIKISETLTRLYHAILLARGPSNCLLAFFSGLLSAVALVPIGFFPILFITFTVATWLLDALATYSDRRVFSRIFHAGLIGWLFGFGYFLGGLWWIGAAFFVTPEYAFLAPLGVLGVPFLLAFSHAFGFVAAHFLWQSGWRRIFAFCFGLGAAEMARAFLFTGFPWNTFGQSLTFWLTSAQITSVIGTDGLTVLTLFIFASPATLTDKRSPGGKRFFISALFVLAGIFAFGFTRLSLHGGLSATISPAAVFPDIRLRVVQPNAPQARVENQDIKDLRTLLTLSLQSEIPPTHIIWPELPFFLLLLEQPQIMEEIRSALPPDSVLLAGLARRDAIDPEVFYNALLSIDVESGVASAYDKRRLVPFGEYLPFRGVLSSLGLERLVSFPGEFISGKKQSFDIPSFPRVWPMICYEAIFPQDFFKFSKRPEVILNVSNDGWFGQTPGPYQHFYQARARAIEFGLPLIRVANTGISAVLDPYGRVVKSTMLFSEGGFDSFLPKPIKETFYSRFGWFSGLFILVLLFFIAFFSFKKIE